MESKTLISVALLVLRLVLGVIMTAHGMQKVGLIGDGGIQQTLDSFAKMSIPAWATYCNIAAELLGGIGIVVGLLGRFAAMGIAASMLVAIWVVHLPNGLFASEGGFELPLALAGMAIALILTGMGPYSIDALIARKMDAATGTGGSA
ncbi:MAG: DoxX family protein [Armatimonadota bacterium]